RRTNIITSRDRRPFTPNALHLTVSRFKPHLHLIPHRAEVTTRHHGSIPEDQVALPPIKEQQPRHLGCRARCEPIEQCCNAVRPLGLTAGDQQCHVCPFVPLPIHRKPIVLETHPVATATDRPASRTVDTWPTQHQHRRVRCHSLRISPLNDRWLPSLLLSYFLGSDPIIECLIGRTVRFVPSISQDNR